MVSWLKPLYATCSSPVSDIAKWQWVPANSMPWHAASSLQLCLHSSMLPVFSITCGKDPADPSARCHHVPFDHAAMRLRIRTTSRKTMFCWQKESAAIPNNDHLTTRTSVFVPWGYIGFKYPPPRPLALSILLIIWWQAASIGKSNRTNLKPYWVWFVTGRK